jgi:hypothetical protein
LDSDTKIETLDQLISAMRGETGLDPIVDVDDDIVHAFTHFGPVSQGNWSGATKFHQVIVETTRPDESFDVMLIHLFFEVGSQFIAFVKSPVGVTDPLFKDWTVIGRFKKYEDVVMKIYEI